MNRTLTLLYGVAAYAVSCAVCLYAIGFLGNNWVPKTINMGITEPINRALLINLALMAVCMLQHTLMARTDFKRWWAKICPPAIERSTYTLVSTLLLGVLFFEWRPMLKPVWQSNNANLTQTLQVLFGVGWATVILASFLVNNFHLFGLRQAYRHFQGKDIRPPKFKKPAMIYKFVRHPGMLGLIIAMWATPMMTQGQVLFAFACTCYIYVAIKREERNMRKLYGGAYKKYQNTVPMLVPIKTNNHYRRAA